MDNLPPEALKGAGGSNNEDDAAKQAQQEEQQQLRRDMLKTIMEPAARERLSRIALVSQPRSQQIEALLIRMAQGGQLKSRVTEPQLIDLLDQMEEVQGSSKANSSKIIYQRRKELDDDFDL